MSTFLGTRLGIGGLWRPTRLADLSGWWDCLNTGSVTQTYLDGAGERVTDGDMEAVGVANWVAGSGGVATKETGTPHSGTQCLRLTDAVDWCFCAQDPILTVGARYRVSGWMRSDGTAVGLMQLGAGNTILTSSTSTSWTYYEGDGVATATDLRLRKNIAGAYVEWDDVSCVEIPRASQLDDLSGLGRHLTQSTAAIRPAYEATGWNGLPCLLFNGVDEYMVANAVAADFNGEDKPMTVIIAAQAVSRGSSGRMWSMGEAGENAHWVDVVDDGTNWDCKREDDGGTNIVVAGSTATSTNRFIFSYVFPGTTISTWYNGAQDLSASAFDVGTCTHDQFALGCLLRAAAGSFMNIRVPEMMIFKRALANWERQECERCLIAKWGVS